MRFVRLSSSSSTSSATKRQRRWKHRTGALFANVFAHETVNIERVCATSVLYSETRSVLIEYVMSVCVLCVCVTFSVWMCTRLCDKCIDQVRKCVAACRSATRTYIM